MRLYSVLQRASVMSRPARKAVSIDSFLSLLGPPILDILFPVEDQPKDSTQEELYPVRRRRVGDILFQLLGPKVWKGFRKGFGEPAPEHDYKLQRDVSRGYMTSTRAVSRPKTKATRQVARIRTAMSGLSASTYS